MIIPFLAFCLVATCNAELRTWTAVNGNKVEAEFISNDKGIVKLKLKSGKIFEVPLNKLSKADQDFLKAKPSSGSLAENIVGRLITFESDNGLIQLLFNEDGVMMHGDGGGLKDLRLTYKIEGNEVLVFQDEERDGGVSFPSSRPKVGDQVEVGSKEEKKSAKITKIESADKILNDLVAKDKPAEAVSVNPNLKYEIKDGTVTITGCDKKASGALTIPATMEGNPVTSIGDFAFTGCTSLTGITIPDSVTSIGILAFCECTNLTSIAIPDGVTSIVVLAFNSCYSLTSITIPDSVTSIGDSAFARCRSLTSVTIGDSVTSIGTSAFSECKSLTSITIPDSVTSIRLGAFWYCTSLTAVTFLGDAPKEGKEVFKDSVPTIYRKPEAKGWGDTWSGKPVKLISEKPQEANKE